jgi:glucose/mannose transport system permease protein
MYQFSFNRGQLALGASAAMMMLMAIVAVLVPLMYLEARASRHVR